MAALALTIAAGCESKKEAVMASGIDLGNLDTTVVRGADFFQYLDSNLFLFIIQILIDIHQPVVKLIDIHTRQFIDILIMDTKMQSFFIQTSPFTFGTNRCFGKLFRPFLCCCRSILFLQHLNILHHSFVSNKVIGGSTDQRTLDFNPFIRTVQAFIGVFSVASYFSSKAPICQKIIAFLYFPKGAIAPS